MRHFFSLQALKRDNDLYELAKKAEQESSGQPANTDESEILEANTTPDILLQPLRYAHTSFKPVFVILSHIQVMTFRSYIHMNICIFQA